MNNKQFAGAIAAIILAISATVLISWFFIRTMDAWDREDKAERPLKETVEAINKGLEQDQKLRDILAKYEQEQIPRLIESKTLTKEEQRFLILYLKIKELANELPAEKIDFKQLK